MIYVKRIQIPELPSSEIRRLYVYLPREYRRSNRRYPVLYMFDGHNVFYDGHATYGKSWGMKEYLEKTGLPLILVAVECNREGDLRLSEYAPWSFSRRGIISVKGKGQLTMDWIVGKLKPEIDHTYRTLPDRANTLIAGSSMGGLMALYAAVAYRDTFSRAAALSPSLWAGGRHLPALIKAQPLPEDTRIYLDVGTEEDPEGRRGPMASLFETAGLLTLAGATVSAQIVPGAKHSEAYWEQRIPTFFDYLLSEQQKA